MFRIVSAVSQSHQSESEHRIHSLKIILFLIRKKALFECRQFFVVVRIKSF